MMFPQKNRASTNEFNFTTIRLVFVLFLEEIEDTKKHFEINWPLGMNQVQDELKAFKMRYFIFLAMVMKS